MRTLVSVVRRLALDVARTAAVLEIVASPAARLEIQASRMVARCPGCRQQMQIVVPGELVQIAELLAQRPDPETRTALAHETAADLARENAAHGIGTSGTAIFATQSKDPIAFVAEAAEGEVSP